MTLNYDSDKTVRDNEWDLSFSEIFCLVGITLSILITFIVFPNNAPYLIPLWVIAYLFAKMIRIFENANAD